MWDVGWQVACMYVTFYFFIVILKSVCVHVCVCQSKEEEGRGEEKDRFEWPRLGYGLFC